MKEKIAKVVRTVSVPPVMATALLLIVYFTKPGFFTGVGELLVAIVFLAIVPVLAYPLSVVFPQLKKKGREGQRNLAFMMTAIGYPLLVIYAIVTGVSRGYALIACTYFLSLLILLLLNKILHLRASGHASSVAGPIALFSYFFGIKALFAGVLLYALIFWASLALNRHTPKEFIWGSLASVAAFLLSWLWFFAI